MQDLGYFSIVGTEQGQAIVYKSLSDRTNGSLWAQLNARQTVSISNTHVNSVKDFRHVMTGWRHFGHTGRRAVLVGKESSRESKHYLALYIL